MMMNHNLSHDLSASVRSYISLGNSGGPAKVTERNESPLPRRATASAASRIRRAEAPRPGRKNVPRVAPVEAPPVALSAIRSLHETTYATTVVSLTIGPSVDSHDAVRPTSHRWRRRSQFYSWHTQASSYLQWHRPQ
jgi:hypothetical protein